MPPRSQTEFTGVPLIARINLIDEETAPETAEKAASEDDVIEYYRYHAETGDPSAQTWLGSMHMEGCAASHCRYTRE